jgi:L-ascorbate metabolism protein UlaG (beta-lactamase superfamily)
MSRTTLTYIGGPTALLSIDGMRILTDPTFDPPGRYAEPGSTTLVKTRGPAISREDVAPVDLVLLSHHGHKDNLDYEGLELLATGVPALSTAAAATELFGAGLIGLDDWESHRIGDLTITAVPALHGPPGSERLLGHVTGFVIERPDAPSIYVSGDNASLALVQQIAERFPSIDIAVLFAGAARAPGLPGPLTFTAEDAAKAADILTAARVVVLHADDWEHFSDGPAAVAAAFSGHPNYVLTPRGEEVPLDLD